MYVAYFFYVICYLLNIFRYLSFSDLLKYLPVCWFKFPFFAFNRFFTLRALSYYILTLGIIYRSIISIKMRRLIFCAVLFPVITAATFINPRKVVDMKVVTIIKIFTAINFFIIFLLKVSGELL